MFLLLRTRTTRRRWRCWQALAPRTASTRSMAATYARWRSECFQLGSPRASLAPGLRPRSKSAQEAAKRLKGALPRRLQCSSENVLTNLTGCATATGQHNLGSLTHAGWEVRWEESACGSGGDCEARWNRLQHTCRGCHGSPSTDAQDSVSLVPCLLLMGLHSAGETTATVSDVRTTTGGAAERLGDRDGPRLLGRAVRARARVHSGTLAAATTLCSLVSPRCGGPWGHESNHGYPIGTCIDKNSSN
eukprot:SAG11_NODE_2569_length_3213_cov_1.421002_4_plen_247_part_00